jgi:hypothetical protein
MIVVLLNQADTTEPYSTLHRQGRRYKRPKPTYLNTMTLASRGWLFIFCSPP